MGGKLSVAVRYTDKQCVAFKIHTSFFKNKLNTPRILEEDYLKKLISDNKLLKDNSDSQEMSENYESKKAVLAPYSYGFVLIDYHNNHILTANDYNAIITASTSTLYNQYRDALRSDFMISFQDGEDITQFDLKETAFYDFYASHFITHALRHNAVIKSKGTVLEHDGTIESVVGRVYNLPLEGKSKDEQLSILNDYQKKLYSEPDLKINWDDFNDVTFDYPHFNIVNVGNAKDTQPILDYMQENNFPLSDYEKKVWEEFLLESSKKEENEDDE